MANPSGELWIVAGCNGAGKSTFIERVTAPGERLAGAPTPNLDRNTSELLAQAGYPDPQTVPEDVYWKYFGQADAVLQEEIRRHLETGKVVCVETVLSTEKYLKLVDFARRLGVPFNLVYVTLQSPELAKARVAQRVLAGGHPVPDARVVKRFYKSLDYLPQFAALAHEFWVYDNSDSLSENTLPPQVIHGRAGKVHEMDAECPVDLAKRFLFLLR